MALEEPCLLIEPLHRIKFLLPPELGAANGGFQHPDRLVVDMQRNRERVTVLPAMRKRKARRVAEAVRGSMYNFSNHRQCPDGPRSHSGSEQQLGIIDWPAVGRCRQISVQPPSHDIAGANIVVRG